MQARFGEGGRVLLQRKHRPYSTEKTGCRAGAYPNIKDHSTHEQVLALKLKELLDKVLDIPLSDEQYDDFLDNLIHRALNT